MTELSDEHRRLAQEREAWVTVAMRVVAVWQTPPNNVVISYTSRPIMH